MLRIDGSKLNRLQSKLNALWRYLMVYYLTAPLTLYVVNEYPKSGGTWVGQMLSSALSVPFPRNRMPVWGPCIMHGHYLRRGRMRKPVVVWRDGRDVIVSWYHHCLFVHDDRHSNAALVDRVRRDLPFADYADVAANLPAFLDYAFTRQRSPRFSWAAFVRTWHGRSDAVHTTYEDLSRDAAGELQRVVRELTGRRLAPARAREIADAWSFARQSGRTPGVEHKSSFLRRGVVGDWCNYFGPEACEIFDYHAGEELILAGYEADHTWTRTHGREHQQNSKGEKYHR